MINGLILRIPRLSTFYVFFSEKIVVTKDIIGRKLRREGMIGGKWRREGVNSQKLWREGDNRTPATNNGLKMYFIDINFCRY